MSTTLYWHDYETFGRNPRWCGVAQFAGIRTDEDLNEVGEPLMVYCQPPQDSWPDPVACLITGITPQFCRQHGVTDMQFAKQVLRELSRPGTCGVGFNNIRFDDEFIRALLWRNFYDPYEWAWKDGRSRWDLLDVVRMTRALRPEGIEWPTVDGVASNRLELLSAANGLEHARAHDALSDVEALIGVTRLIKQAQPQLYEYLLKLRDKNEIKKLINLDEKKPFVYVSGRYDAEWNKATIAFPLTAGKNGNVVVYDLRHDPADFIGLDSKELAKKLYATWEERKAEGFVKLPTKELQYNRAAAYRSRPNSYRKTHYTTTKKPRFCRTYS